VSVVLPPLAAENPHQKSISWMASTETKVTKKLAKWAEVKLRPQRAGSLPHFK